MATQDHGVSQPSSETSTASTAPQRRRQRRWLLGAAALVVVAVLLYLFLHHRAPRPAAPPAAAIDVAQSRTDDIDVYLYGLGTVTPVATVTIYSQVTGTIEAVHYREGQMVHRGDALIDIDPRPYQSTLAQAEGTLQRDQGLLAEARMDLTRYQAAYAKNAIARQQVEDQGQTVVQDQGTVQADQGTVSYDQVQLAYCHIVSPITGSVGLRLVDPGNTVFAGSGSTLVVVTQLQPITVVFDVSEDDLPQVQQQLHNGKVLSVDAFDRSNQQLLASGSLTALDNEVDTATGTIKFRARFPNSNLALFPNQFVNARLLLKTLQQVTLVPSAAIQYNGTASFVYSVQSNNTVAVTPVTVLTSNDSDTAVQGLNAGVTVATSGFERIENGARVSYAANNRNGAAPANSARGPPPATSATTP